MGKPLRGSLYPPVLVLFRREHGSYIQDGHANRLVLSRGSSEALRARIFHDDRKSLRRWYTSQRRYAREEAVKLASTRWRDLGWADRARVVPPAASLLVVPFCLVVRGCIADGVPGMFYTAQRFTAETLIGVEYLRRLAWPKTREER
jgi:hypothetical protein